MNHESRGEPPALFLLLSQNFLYLQRETRKGIVKILEMMQGDGVMFVALNEAKQRVWASEFLPKDEAYFCPVCGEQVRLRVGSANAPHFAHITTCTDDFTHDMSDWHREWQELFPRNNREKVISHDGETHRADVLCYGTVIEFQHSLISAEEFDRRNEFYTSAGYKVVWIFDVIDLFDGHNRSGRMFLDGDWRTPWNGDSGDKFRWKHPWRFLDGFLPQEENAIHIFFNTAPMGKFPKDEESDAYIERVSWVNPDFTPAWGRFRTSNNSPGCYYDLIEWLRTRWEREQH